MFIQAVVDKLLADSTLTALLSTYKTKAAIFAVDPAPEGADFPYIIVGPLVDNAPMDTKNSLGRTVRIDMRCYADNNGNSATIETISERVRTVLHRNSITISGHTWVSTDCFGPISADETGAYGRIVTAVVMAEKS